MRSHQKVEQVFSRAIEKIPEERSEFLQRVCGGDEELRSEVESLIAADEEAGLFMAHPSLEHSPEHRLWIPECKPLGVDPQRVGPYKLLRRIGQGGAGTVFLAVRDDDAFKKQVAIKIIHLQSRHALRRFKAERQILAHLDHPGIASIYDGGTTEDDRPYLVMEWIEGEPIDVYCDRHQLDIDERLKLFQKVCSAVHYAHQNLVVHRDLKPGNIMVNRDGQPKLVDFGIAKLLPPEEIDFESSPTQAWHRVMTPDYASPEQVQGKAITTASDIYSLGVILYQLLCGGRPYRLVGRSPRELEEAVASVELHRPSAFVEQVVVKTEDVASICRDRQTQVGQLTRRLAGDLDNIVLMALRQEPRRRYTSAEQLAEDLQRSLTNLPVRARPDTFGYRTSRFLQRHRWGVSIAALIAVLVLGAGLTMLVLLDRIADERDQVLRERDKAQQVASFLERVFQAANPLSILESETPPDAREPSVSKVSARDLLDQGASMIDRELDAQPEVQASLMSVIGRAYLVLGFYPEAQSLLEKALRLQKQTLGTRHPDLAVTLNTMGFLKLELADGDEAERFFKQSLEIRRAHYGDEHESVAKSLAGLGEVYNWRADYRGALSFHERALKIERQVHGTYHLETAESLKRVSSTLMDLGEYARAETLIQQALDVEREFLEEDHVRIAVSVNNLVALRRKQGRLEGAVELQREVLEIYKKNLGENHGLVITATDNLADILWFMGRYEQAEALCRQVLALAREFHGERHPTIGVFLSNLGAALEHQEKYQEAKALYQEALEIARSELGDRHPNTLISLYNLGNIAFGEGRYEEAMDRYQTAFNVVQNLFDGSHFGRANLLQGMGNCKIEFGELDEALSLLREALDIRIKVYGPDHWRVAESQASIGKALARFGQLQEAEAALERSYQIFDGYAPHMLRKKQKVRKLLDALKEL